MTKTFRFDASQPSDELSFLIGTVHEVSEKAKRAHDPVVREILFRAKSDLLAYAICRFSKTGRLTLQYHARKEGPLVYVLFHLGDRKQGAHVPFEHLSGCSQYRTIRTLGNPYVFNRNQMSKPPSRTNKS